MRMVVAAILAIMTFFVCGCLTLFGLSFQCSLIDSDARVCGLAELADGWMVLIAPMLVGLAGAVLALVVMYVAVSLRKRELGGKEN